MTQVNEITALRAFYAKFLLSAIEQLFSPDPNIRRNMKYWLFNDPMQDALSRTVATAALHLHWPKDSERIKELMEVIQKKIGKTGKFPKDAELKIREQFGFPTERIRARNKYVKQNEFKQRKENAHALALS